MVRRGFDYLGPLARTLNDLKGHDILTFEFVQNADDVEGATEVVFSVTDEALVIENDTVFSDCGDQDVVPCLWKTERGHLCDLHSFNLLSSADKQNREEPTTGAFGIGFLTAYQVTDNPVLATAGYHWRLDETVGDTEGRIADVCVGGCESCSSETRTTFTLPWAADPESAFRSATHQEPFLAEDIIRLEQELCENASRALLFTHRISRIVVVHRNGKRYEYIRTDQDEDVTIDTPEGSQRWHLIEGNFEPEATQLRRTNRNAFADHRRADVTVAIRCDDTGTDGLLHAVFPTDNSIKLPVHISANFYPDSDRRSVRTTGHLALWNEAAIGKAGEILADSITTIREVVASPSRLWELIAGVHKLSEETDHQFPVFQKYWDRLQRSLSMNDTVYTTGELWVTPGEVAFRDGVDGDATERLLTELGVTLVHPLIAASVSNLPYHDLGIKEFDLSALFKALSELDSKQVSLHRRRDRLLLWREIDRLLLESGSRNLARIDTLPLWPATDGTFRSAKALYRAVDDEQLALAQRCRPDLCFLNAKKVPEDFEQFTNLVNELTTSRLVDELARPEANIDESAAVALLDWFAQHEEDFITDGQAAGRLRALPIFPSRAGLLPLEDLWLPGGFEDPLGHDYLVNPEPLSPPTQRFLKTLGARSLSLEQYITDLLPGLLDRDPPDESLRNLVVELAKHVDDITEMDGAVRKLRELPLIESTSASPRFVKGSSAYFDDPTIRAVLGDNVLFAVLGSDDPDTERQLFELVGVSASPQAKDVVAAVEEIVATGRTEVTAERAWQIAIHLGGLRLDLDEHTRRVYSSLKDLAWLPCENSDDFRVHDELHTTDFQRLFESQGKFLNFGIGNRNAARPFLVNWLDVKIQPEPKLVVDHLLWCSEHSQQVHNEVLPWLEERTQEDAAAIELLRDKACIPVGTSTDPATGESRCDYLEPNRVFRGPHRFGKFRTQLGETLLRYPSLLTLLGVKESPDADDACQVLIEIGNSHARPAEPLEREVLDIVWHCWGLIDSQLYRFGGVQLFRRFRDCPVVPNTRGMLCTPDQVLLADSPKQRYLPQEAESILVERLEGIWEALQDTGVKPLSREITAEVLNREELHDRLEAELEVEQVLRDRTDALVQIFDRERERLDARQRIEDALRRLEVKLGPRVEARFSTRLCEFGDPAEVDALWVPESHELFVKTSDSTGLKGAWDCVAVELTTALFPELEPQNYAASVSQVLMAKSLADAHQRLERLGHAPLTTVLTEGVEGDAAEFDNELQADPDLDVETGEQLEPEVAECGCPISQLTEGDHLETCSEHLAESLNQDPAPLPEPEDAPEPGAEADTLGQSEAPVSGSGDRPAADLDPELGDLAGEEPAEPSAEVTSDSDSTGVPRRRSGASQRRPRPRRPPRSSFVQVGFSDEENREETAGDTRNRELGDKGEQAVLEFETSEGRIPEQQPVNNPGFDIVSRDESGQVDRYIEVKSLPGSWEQSFVSLTARQFREAQDRESLFWLYVVENTEHDTKNIIRIQDPASKIDKYTFDPGWRGAMRRSESNDEPDLGWLLEHSAELVETVLAAGLGTPQLLTPFGPIEEGDQVEAVWLEERVAITGDPPSEEVQDWAEEEGWQIRSSNDWDSEELIETLRERSSTAKRATNPASGKGWPSTEGFSQHTAESRASFEMSRPGVLGEHPRAYLPWNAKENEALTQLHRQRVSVAEIAEFLGRNRGAIDSQLRTLGLRENQN